MYFFLISWPFIIGPLGCIVVDDVFLFFLILKKYTVSHVSIFHPILNGKNHFDTRLKG
jgi:hypothetical protein